jgi:hypothetical protein
MFAEWDLGGLLGPSANAHRLPCGHLVVAPAGTRFAAWMLERHSAVCAPTPGASCELPRRRVAAA